MCIKQCGHLIDQDTFSCPNGVHDREVPLYILYNMAALWGGRHQYSIVSRFVSSIHANMSLSDSSQDLNRCSWDIILRSDTHQIGLCDYFVDPRLPIIISLRTLWLPVPISCVASGLFINLLGNCQQMRHACTTLASLGSPYLFSSVEASNYEAQEYTSSASFRYLKYLLLPSYVASAQSTSYIQVQDSQHCM